MAGRIIDPDDDRRRPVQSLIENGLLSALVSIVTFVGVGVAAGLINAELGLWTLSVAIPLAVATVVFQSEGARLYSMSRDSGLPSSMRIFRRASPGFASRRPSSMKTLR